MVFLYSRLSYLVMLYQLNRLFCVESGERILMHDEMEIERTGETKENHEVSQSWKLGF
jgi:hypothetical protein